MDAILFSARPTVVHDAIRHLDEHNELYWSVGFRIIRDKFSYPMVGFIHIKGGKVAYKVEIKDIIRFSREHYEGQNANLYKSENWIAELINNIDERAKRRNTLIMTSIHPFSYDTYKFVKYDDGQFIKLPPMSYIRVLPPE